MQPNLLDKKRAFIKFVSYLFLFRIFHRKYTLSWQARENLAAYTPVCLYYAPEGMAT